jgi:hypothetical protein
MRGQRYGMRERERERERERGLMLWGGVTVIILFECSHALVSLIRQKVKLSLYLTN